MVTGARGLGCVAFCALALVEKKEANKHCEEQNTHVNLLVYFKSSHALCFDYVYCVTNYYERVSIETYIVIVMNRRLHALRAEPVPAHDACRTRDGCSVKYDRFSIHEHVDAAVGQSRARDQKQIGPVENFSRGPTPFDQRCV